MPAAPTRILKGTDAVIDFGENVPFTIPVDALVKSLSAEPTPRGVTVWNGRQSVKLLDVTDADGNPVVFTVTLRAERTPMTADEHDAVTRAKNEQYTRKNAKSLKETETREREIMRATDITRAGIADGMKIAGAQNIGDKIKESLGLLDAIRPMLNAGKSLTDGK